MKLSKDHSWLVLAECDNPGSHSHCNLRVLGQLAADQPKYNYSIKIEGALKEFEMIDNDKVIVLSNDNQIQIFHLGFTAGSRQEINLEEILPKNGVSKLCNLHVCPKSSLLGMSILTTKAIGHDPIFEKIMFFRIKKISEVNGSSSYDSKIKLIKINSLDLLLYTRPTILKYCIPQYRGNTAVLLIAEQNAVSTKFSLHGLETDKKVKLGDDLYVDNRNV